ncbi:hypothetical protein F4774DRAFT_45448 [Daldinia eschscholtzii]|nr:hypothetical protein F4774DRAFT_45448 [Daldinia eschscholtzii]
MYSTRAAAEGLNASWRGCAQHMIYQLPSMILYQKTIMSDIPSGHSSPTLLSCLVMLSRQIGMDPLSLTVLALTLAGLVRNVLEKSARVYFRFRHASSELDSLKRYVESLQVGEKKVDAYLTSGGSLLSLGFGEIEDALDDILRGAKQYVVG